MICLLVLFCCLLTGCSAGSIDPHPMPPDGDVAIEAVSHWSQSKAMYRIRLSGDVSTNGKSFTFQGLMHLNGVTRTARLVTFSELGTKLFDVSVMPEGEQLHSTLPGIGLLQVRKLVVRSVRRMLVNYMPLRSDSARADGQRRILQRCEGQICLTNTFMPLPPDNITVGHPSVEDQQLGQAAEGNGVAEGVRGETAVHNESSLLWKATYSNHTSVGSHWMPTMLVYLEPENNEINTRVKFVVVSVAEGEKK
ncbi:hypothetical protein [Halodesulfovibrio sp.]|uniref:hypothetical protein n=1 Tax=Halodesulfovibrio sp. TaxID=1912772 RepID=UPI0025BD96B5|nr:hypothetical protein [Halodesulfovibrio sp.]